MHSRALIHVLKPIPALVTRCPLITEHKLSQNKQGHSPTRNLLRHKMTADKIAHAWWRLAKANVAFYYQNNHVDLVSTGLSKNFGDSTRRLKSVSATPTRHEPGFTFSLSKGR